MGPWVVTQGNPPARVLATAPAIGASMGPWVVTQGNGKWDIGPCEFQHASMGPWVVTQGNTQRQFPLVRECGQLQWGPGL